MKIILFLFLSLQLISAVNGVNVRSCNSPLITENYRDKFRIITPLSSNSLPVIRSNTYWQLRGEFRTVQLQFNEPHYVTGLAIQVNTKTDSPCNYVESEIDLSDYELIISNKRVNIPKRTKINKTFVKVSFTPTYATNIQIRRTSPIKDPTVYCIQYQLYGCTEVVTDCGAPVSYDYTQPIMEDSSYTGECYEDWCSGGLGILTDSNFINFLEWEDTVRFSLSFYQQVGISDISLYILSTDIIATNSQYQRYPMVNGTLVLSINKVLDYIEFSLNSSKSFKVEEITIAYWSDGNNVEIPCHTVIIPTPLSSQNIAFVTITVGLFMFVLGLITPFIVWLVKQKGYIRWKNKRGGNQINNNNNNKEDRTQHLYTDIRSRASAAEVKLPVQYSINGQTEIRPELPFTERVMSPSLTITLEEQVKGRSLDRRNKQNSKDSPGVLAKCDTFLEDNSLYQSRSIVKKKELKRFENLERRDSEVVLRENPHYVSSEQMKMTITTSPKIGEVNYENTTTLSNDSGEVFVAYDKLNHV